MSDMTIKELEERLDRGEDLDDCTDWENPTWHSNEKARFSINIPEWLMYHLDEEADRRAISRSAMINTILVDWADAHPRRRPGSEEEPPAT